MNAIPQIDPEKWNQLTAEEKAQIDQPVDAKIKTHAQTPASGKQYPPELLSLLSGYAGATVLNWLENNHAPQEVIDLVDMALVLTQWEYLLEQGNMESWQYESMIADIPEALHLITRCGGNLGGSGYTPDLVVKWQPPAEAE